MSFRKCDGGWVPPHHPVFPLTEVLPVFVDIPWLANLIGQHYVWLSCSHANVFLFPAPFTLHWYVVEWSYRFLEESRKIAQHKMQTSFQSPFTPYWMAAKFWNFASSVQCVWSVLVVDWLSIWQSESVKLASSECYCHVHSCHCRGADNNINTNNTTVTSTYNNNNPDECNLLF